MGRLFAYYENMIVMVANPLADSGKAREHAERLHARVEAAGRECELHFTESAEQAGEISKRAVEAGCEALYLVGGDGSIGRCAEALVGGDIPLGLLPCGTGNDFARALGLPTTCDAALEVLLRGQIRRVDAIAYTAREGAGVIVNSIGAGIDVQVLKRAAKYKRLGKLSYLLALLGTALLYTGETMRAPGGEEGKMILLFAANGNYVGGGIGLAPRAVMDDGLFDIIQVGDIGRLRLWKVLPGVLDGSFLDAPVVNFTRAETLHMPGRYTVEMDGEIRDMEDIRLKVCKHALPVLC